MFTVEFDKSFNKPEIKSDILVEPTVGYLIIYETVIEELILIIFNDNYIPERRLQLTYILLKYEQEIQQQMNVLLATN